MLFPTTLALAATTIGVSAVPLRSTNRHTHVPLKHINKPTTLRNLIAHGNSRLSKINFRETDFNILASSGTVTNDDVSYVAPVSIGGSTYQLIIDTGSSNTWCGAQGSCEPSGTGQSTGNSVHVSYGSGSFSGTEYTDAVSFGGLTVNDQSIGAASTSQGFNTVDGILGVGPVGLTQGTVSGSGSIPTFLDNLYGQGSISTEVLGVYFAPESGSDNNDANGELTLGGTDSSRYSGSIEYFPVATGGANAPYWGLDVTGFAYDGNSLGGAAAAIVDTGTTLIYIPSSTYQQFLSATGGSSSSGLTSFSSPPTGNFDIQVGGATLTLTPDQYLVPQEQYGAFGLQSGSYYSWITDGGSSGVDSIIGQKFLENYYSVYDATNGQIGFAPRT